MLFVFGPNRKGTPKELSAVTLQPLIDYLPHLVPNIKKFHAHASKVMQLIRVLCGAYPLDLLRYYKDKEVASEDNNEDYAFHYDIAEDESEISPISLGSYAYLLLFHHIDYKYLPQYAFSFYFTRHTCFFFSYQRCSCPSFLIPGYSRQLNCLTSLCLI